MKIKAKLCAVLLMMSCVALPLRANEGKGKGEGEGKPEVKGEGMKHEVPEACKKDADTFCKDMKPGDGKFGPCMKEHKDELSEGCRQALQSKREHARKTGQAFKKIDDACQADVDKFCAGMKPGDGKFGPCMKEHKDEVSQGCKDAMKSMMQAGREKMEGAKKKIEAACADDTQKFCAGMKPGDGKFGPCMKEHKDQLSEGCKKAFGEMKGKMERPKKD